MRKLSGVALALAGLAIAPAAAGEEVALAPTRTAWFGVGYSYLFSESFAPASQSGAGLLAAYEFHVTPTLLVGLPLTYRMYPGPEFAHQLGYGVTIKHLFSENWTSGDAFYPFVDYGLLQQQSFAPDRSGVAVSHDTRLGAGVVTGALGALWFGSVAAHYSRIDGFDTDGMWVPYAELTLGWVLPFRFRRCTCSE